ncbi:hypothetical protein Tco_1312663 [Tanacetum coccineum]
MTRSSNKDLIQPFENPERVFRSSRKLSKTRSLDYLSSSEFNFISDLKDQFEKEETEAIAKTMEEYMTKTRDGYGSDANEHIEKVLAIVDLFHIPNITQDQICMRWSCFTRDSRTKSTETSDRLAAIQAQLNNLGREIKKVNEKLYVAQVGYELCKGPHYTKDCPLKEEGKTLEEEAYTINLDMSIAPTGEQYRAAARGLLPKEYLQITLVSKIKENHGIITEQVL